MGYKLEIGYTELERKDFIVAHNHNQGLLITEDEYGIFATSESEIIQNGEIVDISETPEYIADQKASQLEILTGQYTNDKCERMVSWVSTFINGISTATSLEDIKSKANTFKTKLAALQSDYTTKCEEVENA